MIGLATARSMRPDLVGNRVVRRTRTSTVLRTDEEHNEMRKFHSIAALCGDGLRPELQALFDRLAIDPHAELFVRSDGMIQAGPDPAPDCRNQNRPLRNSA